METITISDNDYDSFASVADADKFLAVDVSLSAGWSVLEEAGKQAALISATRAMQACEWTELPDPTPVAVINATAVMAALLVIDPDLLNALDAATNIARVKADTVEVEFSRDRAANRKAKRKSRNGCAALPERVREMIAPYIVKASRPVYRPYDAGANSKGCSDSCKTGVTSPFA